MKKIINVKKKILINTNTKWTFNYRLLKFIKLNNKKT